MRLLALLLACALLALPAPAAACSCLPPPREDQMTLYRRARDQSDVILIGRVVEVKNKARYLKEARIQVLEVIKGEVDRVVVMQSEEGSCSRGVPPPGEYLISTSQYVDGGLQPGGMCASWQAVLPVSESEHPMFRWLKTGSFASLPEALVREQVQCTPCNLETVAAKLVGSSPGNARGLHVEREGAEQALKKGRPFWLGGEDDPASPGRLTAVGRSSSLRAFELTQTPHHGTEETCRQRVTRRWCARLEPVPSTDGKAPALRCVDPGPEQELCDEQQGRKSTWTPQEPLHGATCSWHQDDRARCRLGKPGPPLDLQGQEPPWLLACSPLYARPEAHGCRVLSPDLSPLLQANSDSMER